MRFIKLYQFMLKLIALMKIKNCNTMKDCTQPYANYSSCSGERMYK